jgi:hypothetical protein
MIEKREFLILELPRIKGLGIEIDQWKAINITKRFLWVRFCVIIVENHLIVEAK